MLPRSRRDSVYTTRRTTRSPNGRAASYHGEETCQLAGASDQPDGAQCPWRVRAVAAVGLGRHPELCLLTSVRRPARVRVANEYLLGDRVQPQSRARDVVRLGTETRRRTP